MKRFINDEDYFQCIDEKAFSTVKGTDSQKVITAENTAIDEVTGYFDRYDTKALFAFVDDARPAKLVSVICDISLYHLICSLPGRMGYETRKERYDAAIKWLHQVQMGSITPAGFPAIAEQINNASVMMGGQPPKEYIW